MDAISKRLSEFNYLERIINRLNNHLKDRKEQDVKEFAIMWDLLLFEALGEKRKFSGDEKNLILDTIREYYTRKGYNVSFCLRIFRFDTELTISWDQSILQKVLGQKVTITD